MDAVNVLRSSDNSSDNCAAIEFDIERLESNVSTDLAGPSVSHARQSMLVHIARSNDHFCRMRQRHEPDLSFEDRMTLCSKLLDSNPGEFLARFGSLLRDSDLGNFEHLVYDYVVSFRIAEIKRRLTAIGKDNQRVTKNRR
jgi:hypothetical protein